MREYASRVESNNIFGPEYKIHLSKSLSNGDGKKIIRKFKTRVGEREVRIMDYIARLQENTNDNDEVDSRNRANSDSIIIHPCLLHYYSFRTDAGTIVHILLCISWS